VSHDDVVRAESRSAGAATNLFVAQRARFHIAYRSAIRLLECINGFRDEGLSSRRLRQQGARLVADLTLGPLLGRLRGEWLVPRLGLDVADIATSSTTQGNNYMAATSLGVPLALEAGVRRGAAGLLIPVTNLIGVAALRKRRNLPVRPATIGWQCLAVVGGSAIRSYLDYERDVAAEGNEEVVAADCGRARLAGRNSVATRADAIVDILIRTAPILETSGLGQSPTQLLLSSWKAMLATETEQQAMYLKTVLDRWRRRHNVHPDLSRDVDFDLPPGQWTILLSKGQGRDLAEILDRLDLRGTVSTLVLDDAGQRVGEPFQMSVGQHGITIPGDEIARPRRLDLGPAALWLAAVLSAISLLPSQGRVPFRRVAPSVGWFVLAGLWAQRQINRYQGDAAHDATFLACSAGSLLHSAITTGAVRNRTDENGWVRHSYLSPLYAELALALLYGRRLSRATKLVSFASGAIGVIIGFLMSESGIMDFAYNLVWLLVAFMTFRGLAEALDAEATRFENDLRSSNAAMVATAFEFGQQDVIDLVTPLSISLRRLLDESSDEQLSPDDIVEVRRRLDEVEVRLSTIRSVLSTGFDYSDVEHVFGQH